MASSDLLVHVRSHGMLSAALENFTPPNAPAFASIFTVGLFFKILFRRSGTSAIVATIHGIGNASIVASLGSLR